MPSLYTPEEEFDMVLRDLQEWYNAQCDGDWEHGAGITIATLDNPGWAITINLAGTLLEEKAFVPVSVDESPRSWMRCRVEDTAFLGYGDPGRLEEILTVFLNWAKSVPDWLSVEYAE
jgi:hypothetical protein